jgi:putative endonuclease
MRAEDLLVCHAFQHGPAYKSLLCVMRRCHFTGLTSLRSGVRQHHVYILASKSRRLYVGVTGNLQRRLLEHRNGLATFTSRYRINRLVYFDVFSRPIEAIKREKRIKSLLRSRKIALIESSNPAWDDLSAEWGLESSAKPVRTARHENRSSARLARIRTTVRILR